MTPEPILTKIQVAIPFYWLKHAASYPTWAKVVFTVVDLTVVSAIGVLAYRMFLT